VEPLSECLLDGALPSVKDEYETVKSRYFGIQTTFNFGGFADIARRASLRAFRTVRSALPNLREFALCPA
jgi:hypothetical protein